MTIEHEVFIRIRPSPDATAPCGQIAADGKTFVMAAATEGAGDSTYAVDKVFPATASGAEVWATVGKKALDTALAGKHVCVAVVGGAASGCWRTAVGRGGGECGIVDQLVKSLAGNADASLQVLLCRGEGVFDLGRAPEAGLQALEPAGLKVKFDEQLGAYADGAETFKVGGEGGADHVAKCLEHRDALLSLPLALPVAARAAPVAVGRSGPTFEEAEAMREAAAAAHRRMASTVFVFTVGVTGSQGTITVVQLAATNSVLAAGVPEHILRENTARQKPLAAALRCLRESPLAPDAKAINWRASRMCRFLQAGVSAALDQRGYLALVVTISDAAADAMETRCNCRLAAAVVKEENLKTIGQYKTIIEQLQERTHAADKERTVAVAQGKVDAAAAVEAAAATAEGLQGLMDQQAAVEQRIPEMEAVLAAEVEALRVELEEKKAAHRRERQAEVERMRNIATNAPAQAEADSKAKAAEVEAAHKARCTQLRSDTTEAVAATKALVARAADLRRTASSRAKREEVVMRPVKAAEAELEALEATLAAAGPPRDEGLSEEEKAAKAEEWAAIDHIADLEEKVHKSAADCMAFEHAIRRRIGAPRAADDGTDGSPTASNAASPAASSSDSSSSSSTSSSSSSSSSSSASSSNASTSPSEAARREAEAAEEATRKQELEDFEEEFDAFREVLHREDFLHSLVDKICAFIDYGTNVTVVTPKGFERRFLYFAKGRQYLAYTAEVEQGDEPSKDKPQAAVSLAGVQELNLGQHSPAFHHCLEQVAGRVDPQRADTPPPIDALTVSNMHRFYYRSFSVCGERGEWLDVICDTPTDFEAIVVGLHRVTRRDAAWGRQLLLDFAERAGELADDERAFCETVHLTPVQFFKARDAILGSDQQVFITLHEMRLRTGFDLYHCQKLLEFYIKAKWVIRRRLVYFRAYERIADGLAGPDGESIDGSSEGEEEEEDMTDDLYGLGGGGGYSYGAHADPNDTYGFI